MHVIYCVKRRYRYMLQCFKEIAVWLSRIGHCRGFGIQSPTDYSFVCHIVNGKDGDGLAQTYPNLDRVQRRLCGLYYRIAAYMKPQVVVDGLPNSEARRNCIHQGCPSASIVGVLPENGMIDFLCFDAANIGDVDYDKAIGLMGEGAILVVDGIKCGRKGRQGWKRIKSDDRITITFDLYYAGIAVKDSKRYKQDYIVNF